jgi:hypothetical protein
MTLKEWLQEARQLRVKLPNTSDSVEILRQLRPTSGMWTIGGIVNIIHWWIRSKL